MKFRLTFKTPDVTAQIPADMSLEYEERNSRLWEAIDFANKFLMYGESITVEFDTNARTATVLKTNQ